jgi:CheY-like chemotaxis protein
MGFRLILEAEADIEVVGEAGDGASGVNMASALHPDVVLMDVRIPGMDGIKATASIIEAGPASKVVVPLGQPPRRVQPPEQRPAAADQFTELALLRRQRVGGARR